MRFGVNYTPSGSWFHSWLDLDPQAVARDLDQVAALGVDHVRLFPLWPLLQPSRTVIRDQGLADVLTVVDLAGRAGLDVVVDAVQGHLSSFDFVPSWLESWHRRNMFSDPAVVTALEEYVRRLSAALADRPQLLGVTVGNEVNQFASAPHPDPHLTDSAEADRWLDRMITAAREGLAGNDRAVVTHAMYDAAWYDDAHPFEPRHAAGHGDLSVVHSWVFNGAARLEGPLAASSVRHAEYLLLLTAAWSAAPDRGVWLQEVGAPTNVVPDELAADFLEQTLRSAATVPGLWGMTWWCSHDVPRRYADFPEVEYGLGLYDEQGRLKPTGERFAATVAALRGVGASPPSSVGLVLDDRPGSAYRSASAPGGSFYRAWMRTAEAHGRGPQVVLRSRVDEPDHLRGRGIATLHYVEHDDRAARDLATGEGSVGPGTARPARS